MNHSKTSANVIETGRCIIMVSVKSIASSARVINGCVGASTISLLLLCLNSKRLLDLQKLNARKGGIYYEQSCIWNLKGFLDLQKLNAKMYTYKGFGPSLTQKVIWTNRWGVLRALCPTHLNRATVSDLCLWLTFCLFTDFLGFYSMVIKYSFFYYIQNKNQICSFPILPHPLLHKLNIHHIIIATFHK